MVNLKRSSSSRKKYSRKTIKPKSQITKKGTKKISIKKKILKRSTRRTKKIVNDSNFEYNDLEKAFVVSEFRGELYNILCEGMNDFIYSDYFHIADDLISNSTQDFVDSNKNDNFNTIDSRTERRIQRSSYLNQNYKGNFLHPDISNKSPSSLSVQYSSSTKPNLLDLSVMEKSESASLEKKDYNSSSNETISISPRTKSTTLDSSSLGTIENMSISPRTKSTSLDSLISGTDSAPTTENMLISPNTKSNSKSLKTNLSDFNSSNSSKRYRTSRVSKQKGGTNLLEISGNKKLMEVLELGGNSSNLKNFWLIDLIHDFSSGSSEGSNSLVRLGKLYERNNFGNNKIGIILNYLHQSKIFSVQKTIDFMKNYVSTSLTIPQLFLEDNYFKYLMSESKFLPLESSKNYYNKFILLNGDRVGVRFLNENKLVSNNDNKNTLNASKLIHNWLYFGTNNTFLVYDTGIPKVNVGSFEDITNKNKKNKHESDGLSRIISGLKEFNVEILNSLVTKWDPGSGMNGGKYLVDDDDKINSIYYEIQSLKENLKLKSSLLESPYDNSMSNHFFYFKIYRILNDKINSSLI